MADQDITKAGRDFEPIFSRFHRGGNLTDTTLAKPARCHFPRFIPVSKTKACPLGADPGSTQLYQC
jgi:hypothetical protein